MAEEGMPPLAAGWSVEEVAAWVLTLEGIDDLEAVAAKIREEEVGLDTLPSGVDGGRPSDDYWCPRGSRWYDPGLETVECM